MIGNPPFWLVYTCPFIYGCKYEVFRFCVGVVELFKCSWLIILFCTWIFSWVELTFGSSWFVLGDPLLLLDSSVSAFKTASVVSPDQDCKYPFVVDSIHVGRTGMNAAAWRYWIVSVSIDILPTLLDRLVGSICRSCLLDCVFWSKMRQSPVWCYLIPCRIMNPFLGIWTVCFSKHPYIMCLTSFQLRWVVYVVILGVSELLYLQLGTVVAPVCTLWLMVVCCRMMMIPVLCVFVCVYSCQDNLAWGMFQMILYLQVHTFISSKVWGWSTVLTQWDKYISLILLASPNP